MANHFVVQHITRLHAVNHHSFLIVSHTRNHGDGLVVVNIERLILGLDLLHAQTFQGLDKLMEDQLHTLLDGFRVFGCISQSTFEIVKHGQDGSDGLLAAIENQLSLLLDGTFAVVLELGTSTQVLVFELFNLFLGFF